MDNIKLLEFSFKNKEDYIDIFYNKDNKLIISENPKKINELMKANMDLIDNIISYKIAYESDNFEMQDTILENIIESLQINWMNCSEFVSYWGIKDISYSYYSDKLKTILSKKDFLKKIIIDYINDRHNYYRKYWYSSVNLQSISDSKSHKSSGNSWNIKVSTLFNWFWFNHFEWNLEEFILSDKIYIYPDKTEKKLFLEIIKKYNIKFEWSKNHENKQTDFLFKFNGTIYIMEHKHMKESWWWQDKQMTEIINFISYNEKDIWYISFLDWVYFNKLWDNTIKKWKIINQKKSIYKNLKNNKNNFFVNTKWFIKLLETL